MTVAVGRVWRTVTDHHEAVEAGKVRADEASLCGMRDLEAELQATPEWGQTTHFGSSRPSTIPKRAALAGMLGHVRDAYDRNHPSP